MNVYSDLPEAGTKEVLSMKKNVGTVDRAVRVVVGVALIAWALLGTSEYAWAGWIGVAPLLTAVMGWCPPYSLLGINTCGMKNT